jgi:hypothetical protein
MPRPDNTDHIVRIGRQQLVLVFAADHVVRWRSYLGETADPLRVEADTAERREDEAG